VERFDVVIIGGGAMGTAAARTLGSRGREVLVLERFRLGHRNGSSGGPTRNVRLTYHDPVYVRMARLAFDRWRQLESEAGTELLRTVGGLDVGSETAAAVDALAAAGERFEVPSAGEVAERWPMLRFRGQTAFLFQPEGAVVRADEALRVQARLARELGATIREGTVAEVVKPASDGVDVVTSTGGVVHAPAAIVAAGAWAGPLLRDGGVDLPLRPTLEQSTTFEPEPERYEGVPTVIEWATDRHEPLYLVPDPFRPGALKAGAHLSGPVIDPDRRTFEPDAERGSRVTAWVRDRVVPAPEPVETETCLYTVTPDEDFVLDRVGPVVVASPCSGHGFKFTPLVGEIAADLVTGARPAVPLDRFRIDRPSLGR
jgi:sarcosine oxidase